MENLSIRNKSIIWAYERGTRFKDGEIISFTGKKLKLRTSGSGYYMFAYRPLIEQHPKRQMFQLMVHRFVAYCKFKERIFEPNVVVRHLDGNPKNNHPDNIKIGSPSDNMMD
jgi:hypothetical protein